MASRDITTEGLESPVPGPVLVAYAPGRARSTMSAQGEILVGRALECGLPIDDASVSRRHAIFRFGNQGATVEDLGSRNGVRVSGTRIAANKPAPLAPDTVVELGRVVLVYRERPAEPGSMLTEAPPVDAAGEESPMERATRLVDLVASSTISVILRGETGVGKDVFAERIHLLSPRRQKPFVALNCAAIAENLIESELFGHERGAFTGAAQAKVGLLPSAAGGTVFLDEIAELPLGTQAKLLRALEKREVLPVGANRPRPFDARFLAATHKNLEDMVAKGSFRADLFFRLNGMTIEIAPLRQRTGEIAGLATMFVSEACARLARAPATLSKSALQKLEAYSFPGNVRELRNLVERATLLATDGVIDAKHFELSGPQTLAPPPRDSSSSPMRVSAAPSDPNLRTSVESTEIQCILDALEQTGGNQTKAAEILGVSRRTLVYRLSRYSLRDKKGAVE